MDNWKKPFARLSNVTLFSGAAASMSSSSSSALNRKHSSPSSCLLLISLSWYLLVLEFCQDPYLELLSTHTFLGEEGISTISFMVSLIGSVVNPVVMHIWSFLQQGFILGLMVFTAFSVTDDIVKGVIFPHFHVLSGFSSITLTILSIEYHV